MNLEESSKLARRRAIALSQNKTAPVTVEKGWEEDLIQAFGISQNSHKWQVKKPMQQSVWVYRCIQIWNQLASVPLILEERSPDAIVPVQSGSLFELLRMPTSRKDTSTYLSELVLSLAHYGEYFVLMRGANGRPTDKSPVVLEYIPPLEMSIETWDAINQPLVWKRSRVDNNSMSRVEEYIDDRYIIHYAMPNPYTIWRGLGPLEVLHATVDSEYATRLHNLNLMRAGGSLQGLLSFKGQREPTQDSIEKLHRDWTRKFNNPDGAGATAILGGDWNYQALGATSKDLDWLNATKVSIAEISAAFGIPQVYVGEDSRSTFTNMETARRFPWQETILPLGKKAIVAPHQRKLGHMEPAAFLRFEESEIPAMQDDEDQKVDRFSKLVSAGVSRYEAKRLTGLKIDLDEEFAKTEFIPVNMLPIEFMMVQQVEEEPEAPVVAPPPPDLDDDDEEEDVAAASPATGVTKDESARDIVWKALRTEKEGYEREFTKRMRKFFFRQRSETLRRLAKFIDDDLPILRMQQRALTEEEAEVVDSIYDPEEWDQELREEFRPMIALIVLAGYRQILQSLGRPDTTQDRPIISEIEGTQVLLMQSVNRTTRDRLAGLRQIVDEGIADEKPSTEIADEMEQEVKGVFRSAEKDRAELIAETEVGRTYEAARYQAMKDEGIDEREWISSRDEVVRDSHRELDGKRAVWGQSFKEGMTLRYPRDPAAPPDEVIRCRCESVPVIPPLPNA